MEVKKLVSMTTEVPVTINSEDVIKYMGSLDKTPGNIHFVMNTIIAPYLMSLTEKETSQISSGKKRMYKAFLINQANLFKGE